MSTSLAALLITLLVVNAIVLGLIWYIKHHSLRGGKPSSPQKR
jgi:hypothetical protein